MEEDNSAIGYTFYGVLFGSFIIMMILIAKSTAGITWFITILAATFAGIIAFFTALIHAGLRSPQTKKENDRFWSLPVHNVDATDSLMADELIHRHKQEAKQQRRQRDLALATQGKRTRH